MQAADGCWAAPTAPACASLGIFHCQPAELVTTPSKWKNINFPKLGTGGESQLLTLELTINNGDLTGYTLTWDRAQHLENIKLMLTHTLSLGL